MRSFKWMFIAGIAAAVLTISCCSILTHNTPTPPVYTVSGGPLDIKLIAIRPDTSEDFFDVNGNKVENLALPKLPNPQGRKDYGYCMDFVFQLPEDEDILWPRCILGVFTDGNGQLKTKQQLGGAGNYRITELAGKKVLIAQALFFDGYHTHSFWKGCHRKSYSHIELRLNYFHGPLQDKVGKDVVLKGPFKAVTPLERSEKFPTVQPGLEIGEDIIDDAGVTSANFTVTGLSCHGLFYVYDKSGKRHMISRKEDVSVTSMFSAYTFYIKGLKLSDIESIIGRQEFHTRSFNNINVDYLATEK